MPSTSFKPSRTTSSLSPTPRRTMRRLPLLPPPEQVTTSPSSPRQKSTIGARLVMVVEGAERKEPLYAMAFWRRETMTESPKWEPTKSRPADR